MLNWSVDTISATNPKEQHKKWWKCTFSRTLELHYILIDLDIVKIEAYLLKTLLRLESERIVPNKTPKYIRIDNNSIMQFQFPYQTLSVSTTLSASFKHHEKIFRNRFSNRKFILTFGKQLKYFETVCYYQMGGSLNKQCLHSEFESITYRNVRRC